jgi:hypothetical protein
LVFRSSARLAIGDLSHFPNINWLHLSTYLSSGPCLGSTGRTIPGSRAYRHLSLLYGIDRILSSTSLLHSAPNICSTPYLVHTAFKFLPPHWMHLHKRAREFNNPIYSCHRHSEYIDFLVVIISVIVRTFYDGQGSHGTITCVVPARDSSNSINSDPVLRPHPGMLGIH